MDELMVDSKKGEKNNWKEYLPLVTIALIVASTFRHFIFYSFYKVPISEYLTISDVGFILINDFILLIGMAVFTFLYSYFASVAFPNNNIAQELERKEPTSPKTKKRSKLSYFLWSISFVALPPTIQYFYRKFVDNYTTRYWTFVIIALAAIVIVGIFCLMKGKFLEDKNLRRKYLLSAMVCTYFFYQIGIALGDIESINKGKTTGTTIVTQDTVLISNAKVFYIGKIQDYAFFYNSVDSTALSIPMSQVKEIKHTNNLQLKK